MISLFCFDPYLPYVRASYWVLDRLAAVRAILPAALLLLPPAGVLTLGLTAV